MVKDLKQVLFKQDLIINHQEQSIEHLKDLYENEALNNYKDDIENMLLHCEALTDSIKFLRRQFENC